MPGSATSSSAADDARFTDARPTFSVGGQESDALKQGLLRLLIVETYEGLYRCEATFGNYGADAAGGGRANTDYRYFDRRLLEFGKPLRITLGDPPAPLFDGRITALEARFPRESPPELTVLAEDALQDLRMTRRTRTFADTSDADVFGRIADEHGLSKDIRLQGPTHKVLAQLNQSDLAFLRERARAADAELWIATPTGASGSATLTACPRSERARGAAFKLGYRNELREFSVIADLAEQRTSVIASGWDTSAKRALEPEATDSEVTSELDGGESGASILMSKLGARKEVLVHTAPADAAEAEARARAYFRRMARRFVVGHGVVRTEARLRVGNLVDLDGLGPLFSGKYYLSEVSHRFDGKAGLRTEITVERPGLGRP